MSLSEKIRYWIELAKSAQRSKDHYMFCDTREMVLIGDWIYSTEISQSFDAEGYRYGLAPLMSRKHWDEQIEFGLRQGDRLDGTIYILQSCL